MDDQLLNDLYGIEPQDHQDGDMIKAAQAELVESVADEAGIDLAEMDDAELDKFASYVLSDASDDVYTDPSLAEADQMGRVMAHAYADEQIKIAHQLEEQYLTQGDDTMYDDLGYALEKQAQAWDFIKEAKEYKDMSNLEKIRESRKRKGMEGFREGGATTGSRRDYLKSLVGRGTGYFDLRSARGIGKEIRKQQGSLTSAQLKDQNKLMRSKEFKDAIKGLNANTRRNVRKLIVQGDFATAQKMLAGNLATGTSQEIIDAAGRQARSGARRGLMMRGAGKAGLVAGGLGLAGYGASRSMQKKSSYDPVIEMVEDLDGWEFAKEAELRAAEILLENGVDPETFEETYPESVKLASFPEPGEAHTYEGDEELIDYNEMLDDAAYDILEDLGF